jgi:soluble lytic murein transglycosylase-like protein
MRRATRVGILAVFAVFVFWAGVSYHRTTLNSDGLLSSGVSMSDRVASLRMRVAAVEKENQNLRTELRVRKALARSGRVVGAAEADRIVASILEAHNRYDLSTEVLLAVIETESGFDSRAVSSKGALGLMQLMPSTGQEMADRLDIPWTGNEMLYDPAINIQLGSEYLYQMFKRFGHADNALAAYNAGPRRVEGLNEIGILPRDYPGRVRQGLKRYAP